MRCSITLVVHFISSFIPIFTLFKNILINIKCKNANYIIINEMVTKNLYWIFSLLFLGSNRELLTYLNFILYVYIYMHLIRKNKYMYVFFNFFYRYISSYTCTNTELSDWFVRDSSKSFPSGHAALSLYMSIFLVVRNYYYYCCCYLRNAFLFRVTY